MRISMVFVFPVCGSQNLIMVRLYGFGMRFGTMVGCGGTVLGYSQVELLGTDTAQLAWSGIDS